MTAKRSKLHFLTLLKVIFLILLAAPSLISAQTGDVTLTFDTLPSTQGWSYLDDVLPHLSTPETTYFSIVGNNLHMDTTGRFGDGTYGYKYDLPVGTQPSFAITINARITGYQVHSAGGFNVYAVVDLETYSFGVAPGTLLVGENTFVTPSFDVADFHEYRLEAIPGTGVDLYVDGVFVGSGATYSSEIAQPFLYFGDGTRGGDAIADIASYTFDPTPEGCYIAAPASVNEGTNFTASVRCDEMETGVYGFELGTSASGNASTSATSYIPGSFVTDAGDDILEASNTLNLYSVSRRAPATAATGDFTLGSVDYTATSGLTANGSATFSLDSLLLGDISGGSMTVPLFSSTTVTVIDLLTLNLTVASDGYVQQVRNVTASLDSITRGPQTASGTSLILSFTDALEMTTPTLTADIDSHLMCSSVLNLTTSVTDMTTTLKAGDVVLNGSDASAQINLYDAVTIGLAFGTAGTGEEDVNGDGTVNIFDLIHVGRNYGSVASACV